MDPLVRRDTLFRFLPVELVGELEQFRIASEWGPIPPICPPPRLLDFMSRSLSWAYEFPGKTKVHNKKRNKCTCRGMGCRRNDNVHFRKLILFGREIAIWTGMGHRGKKHTKRFPCEQCGVNIVLAEGFWCSYCSNNK